jgi:hypothetical protein
MPVELTTDQVWREVEQRSFAVLGYVTPTGESRTTGVDYAVHGRRLYVAVAGDSWKAQHIPRNPSVSVTVLIPRGGPLALLFPIPPATITGHGSAALLQPEEAPEGVLGQALRGVDDRDRGPSRLRVLEVTLEGEFLTYGVGVPLMRMRHPEDARGHAPVDSSRNGMRAPTGRAGDA